LTLRSFLFVTILLLGGTTPARAQPGGPESDGTKAPARPTLNWLNPWQEDWSVLADPALRTDPFDPLKYIPIGSDPKTYLSLGARIRERFESVSFRLTPVQPDNYLLDRTQVHADLHLGPHVQVFTQLIDARAPGKSLIAPIDHNRLDLEEAFVAVTIPAAGGDLNVGVGRQEPEFDLQRFGAVQEGPNVRQPFDSAEVGYTRKDWRVVAFYARPVLTRDQRVFDDVSVSGYTLNGARLERRRFGPGKLSIFVAQLRNDNAFYLAANGRERRGITDAHYTGRAARWDWDVEGMGQWGDVGDKNIRAWGGGALFGYTWVTRPWSPRLGFQMDAASGTDNPSGTTLGTFNPLFPNGFYEMLAGYPGYANFVHARSSVIVHPMRRLSAVIDAGSLWRGTTADAVYLLPAIPVPGTAGHGSAYSGGYGQIRIDWELSPHVATAIDGEYFAHSESLHQAGAQSGHYVGLELRLGF